MKCYTFPNTSLSERQLCRGIGPRINKDKETITRAGIEPMTFGLDHQLRTRATRQ